MPENNLRGSEWLKWDLHFHTPSSFDYGDNSVTNQDIIDVLSQNNISVVAITDHHFIDVERIRELQELGKVKGVTVLPGIELRSELGGKSIVHFIGIFSESCDIEDIWVKLQGYLEISIADVKEKGDDAVYCPLKSSAERIHSLGGIVSVHAGKKSNTIEGIANSEAYKRAVKTDLLERSIDILEIGKADEDIGSYRDIVFPSIGLELPLIICSDNHNVKKYHLKENCWIKAHPTFEGLKQILFEPETRVAIQSQKPDFKENKLIIDYVQYESPSKMFSDERIYLNPNLNTIIGGKSSGKSILLYHIAKTLETNSEIRDIAGDRFDFRISDSDFNFQVTSLAGVTQSLHGGDDERSIIPNIKYIPQNYLVQLAEPDKNRKGQELLKFVRDLILEDTEVNSVYEQFLSSVRANDRERDDLIDTYFEIQDHIERKNKELRDVGNIEVLKKSVQENTQRIENLKASIGLSEEQIREYNAFKKNHDDLNIEKKSISDDFRIIEEFNKEGVRILKELRERQGIVSKSIQNTLVRNEFIKNYEFLNLAIPELEEFINSYKIQDNSWVNNDNVFAQLLLKNVKGINEVKEKLKPFIENEKVKNEIAEIEKIILGDSQKLASVQQLQMEIARNEIALIDQHAKIFQHFVENHKRYVEVVGKLKLRTEVLQENSLEIQGSVLFNFEKFNKAIVEMSDGRRFSSDRFDVFKKSIGLDHFDLDAHLNELKELFKELAIDKSYHLRKGVDPKRAVSLLLDDYFVDYWDVIYKNDTVNQMSTGKASFVILMLIVGLSNSKSPILIDQPEDNLDNRSITKDLVTYLKNKKVDRQIILVTHNPNVVVNADSENIIVANQKGQNDKESNSPFQFDYINGPIEYSNPLNEKEMDILKSMGIREHIADIVEGGEEAFKKRERKYGFKRTSK